MVIVIEIENIWYKYPGFDNYVIENINFVLHGGNVYVLIGSNGAGKTTFLMILAGLLKPVKGDVKINGVSIYSRKGNNLRKHIGLLFQNPEAMIFNPTVYDEIVYSIKQIEHDINVINNTVKYWINYFNLDEDILNRKTYTLSYGYKKLVALISILIYSPDILLLDEPHTGLYKQYFEKIRNLLIEYRNRKKLVVVASSNLKPYKDIADCIIRIEKGIIINTKCKNNALT